MDTPQKIGRYEVIEELGRGAMGTVYRAKDPAMDRVVALKTIISAALDGAQGGEFRERFYREARAAGALAHPGIVPVFDVGEHDGTPFLVMEFVKGKTLSDLMKKGERLSIDRVCEIGQQIAQALSYAHQHGVVHRDIKPANILMTSREAYGIERPKITDFGVAKLAEGQTTMTGQLLGTPAFMPPEQFTGAAIDGRADIFSLGVVLYALATGEQPFPGESMTAVSYKVVHTDPVPPCKLNPSLTVKLDRVIMKCLAKSPADRYSTGDELAAELGEVRKGNNSIPTDSVSTRATQVVHDPNATLVESAPLTKTAPPVAAPAPSQSVPAKGGNRNLILVVALLLVVIAGMSGWYAMRSNGKTVVGTTVQNTAPEPPVASAPVPLPTRVPAVALPKKVSPAAAPLPAGAAVIPKKSDVSTDAKPRASLQPTAKEVVPVRPVVDFDPTALDPKQNARLKIDAEKVPGGVNFEIEMNGKLYSSTTATKDATQGKDLFVPPGVHEFQVTATSNGVTKRSNTVSIEFKAKKKNTLKIELRTAIGAGVPQGLYPDTQIVVGLK